MQIHVRRSILGDRSMTILEFSPDRPVQVVSWLYLGLDTLVYLGTAGLGSLNRHDTLVLVKTYIISLEEPYDGF